MHLIVETLLEFYVIYLDYVKRHRLCSDQLPPESAHIT